MNNSDVLAGADCRAGSLARDQQSTGVRLLLMLQVVMDQNKEKE